MATVVEVMAKLRTDKRDMVTGFRAAKTEAGNLGKGLHSAGSEAERAGRQASRSGGMFRQAFGFVTGGAMLGGIYAVGRGLKGLGMMGLQAASDQQQAMVAFKQMLGSQKAAADYYKQLQVLAAKTPFEMQDVVLGTKRLMGFGFSAQQAKDYLTAMGDAASGLSTGAQGISGMTMALGQMKAKGKLAVGEITQMASQGVPAMQYLADAMNTTTAEVSDLLTKGAIPADKGIQMIIDGMEKGTKNAKGFGGMMAVQSETLAGLWSTFTDTVRMGLADAITPYIPALGKVVAAATPLVEVVLKGFMKGVAALVGGIGVIVKAASGLKSSFGGGASAFGGIRAAVEDLLPHLMRLGAVVVGTLLPLWKTLVAFYVGHVMPAMAKLLPPVLHLAGVIADALGPVLTALRDALMQVITALGPLYDRLAKYLTPVVKIVVGALGILVRILGTVLPPAIRVVGTVLAWLITGLTAVLDGIAWFVSSVPRMFGAMVSFFNSLPGRLLSGLKALPGLVLSAFVGMIRLVLQALGAWAAVMYTLITKVPVWFVGALKALPGLVGTLFSAMWHNSVASVGNMVRGLLGLGGALYRGLRSWVSRTVSSVVSFISDLPRKAPGYVRSMRDKIISVARGAGGWLISAGKAIVRGLWNGISSLGGWLYGKVKSFVVDNVKSGFNAIMHFGSPSRTAFQWGRWTSQGYAGGLKQDKDKVSGAARVIAAHALPVQRPAVAVAPGAAGRAPQAELVLRSDGSDMSEFLIKMIRQATRHRGGTTGVLVQ